MIAIARQEKQLLLEQTVHEAFGDHAPVPIHITDQHILQDLPDQDGPIRVMWYCHTREVFLFDRDRPHTKQIFRREHDHTEKLKGAEFGIVALADRRHGLNNDRGHVQQDPHQQEDIEVKAGVSLPGDTASMSWIFFLIDRPILVSLPSAIHYKAHTA